MNNWIETSRFKWAADDSVPVKNAAVSLLAAWLMETLTDGQDAGRSLEHGERLTLWNMAALDVANTIRSPSIFMWHGASLSRDREFASTASLSCAQSTYRLVVLSPTMAVSITLSFVTVALHRHFEQHNSIIRLFAGKLLWIFIGSCIVYLLATS